MSNIIYPTHLSNLVPKTIVSSSNYNLRNFNNIHLLFNYKAFLPSAVRDWNHITDEHRNVDTVIAFKNVLKPVVP